MPFIAGPVARRITFVVLFVSVSLVSCGGGGGRDGGGGGGGDGPPFVINAPQTDASTAGTFFFSVQPLDPDGIGSVTFLVGGAVVGRDTTAADGFRVFVSAADHPAGPLDLTADVSGIDGRVRSRTVRVTNVPAPPSTATVGADGAALGTTEASGRLSTLVLPPGTSPGARITFEARTKEHVRTETGVDYDALGLTFLGAQAIESDEALDRTPTVTSGGFGPMVQPEQAVVNYMIGPDADGDGIGEVVVVNSATVAPNGDVISDPVPTVQVGETATVSSARGASLATLTAGLAGPPGSLLEIPVTGFNASSPYGNIARFERGGGTFDVPARIHEAASGAQTFVTAIPALSPGYVTLTLINLGTGHRSEPIGVDVEAAPAPAGSPADAIEASLQLMLDTLRALDAAAGPGAGSDFTDIGQIVAQDVRATVSSLTASGTAEDAQALATMAAMLRAGRIDDLLAGVGADLAGPALRTAQAGCNDILDRADKAMNVIGLAGSPTSAADVPMGEIQGRMFGEWWRRVREATEAIDDALGGNACPPAKPGPGGPGGPSSPTGMGAAVPPGGNIGGGVNGGNRWAPSTAYLLAPQATSPLAYEPGRFVIKLAAGGSPVPFSGTTDAGGYFYIPLVPEGQPFEAVAIDTVTGENRVLEGVGPAVGEAAFLLFDFSDGASETREIRWDGGGDDVNWGDPFNWEGDTLPLPHNDVIIDAPGKAVVVDVWPGASVHSLQSTAGLTLDRELMTIAAASTLSGPLVLQNGGLNLTGDLTMSGDTTWTSGEITGTGTFVNEGTMSIDGDAYNLRVMTGRLRNMGTIVLYGDGDGGLRTGLGARFENEAGAVFDAQGQASIEGGEGDPAATFDNRGTILRSSGSGTSYWTHVDVNHLGGTVDVREGTLHLAEGGISTGGTFQVAAGAAFALGSHTRETYLSGTYAGSGAGVVRLQGGQFFEIAEGGATFAFTGGGVEWIGTAIQGPGTLTNTGVVHIVRTEALSNFPVLHGHLVNEGTMTLGGDRSGGLRNDMGSTIINREGAVFEFRDGQDIAPGNVPMTFTNAGELRNPGFDPSVPESASIVQACLDEAAGSFIGEGVVFESPATCS